MWIVVNQSIQTDKEAHQAFGESFFMTYNIVGEY